MELIFLIYGLAFFLLGFAVLYYPKKDSAFRLAKRIHFVGWFGILHGTNEWLDLLILVRALDISFIWEILRLITLPVSFLALIYFGLETILTPKKKYFISKFLTLILVALFGVLFLVGEHNQYKWDILSRYILCFPGALLTGLSLLLYVPEIKRGISTRLIINLKTAGIAFIAYAFLAGLIVKDAAFFPASVLNYSLFSGSLGIPVQVFRSLCAIVIAYNLVCVLKIFHLEMQQNVLESQIRFQKVVNTAPVTLFIEDNNHIITFFEGKGLSALDIVAADAIGKPTAEVFTALPQVYQGSDRTISNGEEFTDTVFSQGYFYEIFLTPLKDETGIVIGSIGVVIDVSEQKNAQNDLNKYRLQLERTKTQAALGVLGTEITSEITEPLYESKVSLKKALGGLRKIIGAGDVKADIQNGLDNILLVVKILDEFCTKANLQIFHRAEPIDVFASIQRVLSVLRESAQNSMIHVMTEGADIFPVMPISSREFEQVFYILIQNIIQSADGEHIHNLDINFLVQGKKLFIRFYESFISDSAEELADAPTIKSEIFNGKSGHGFEFSVLKGIVEAYEGTITISTKLQDKILYEIELPLAG